MAALMFSGKRKNTYKSAFIPLSRKRKNPDLCLPSTPAPGDSQVLSLGAGNQWVDWI